MENQGTAWYLGYIIVYFTIMFGIGVYYFTKVKNADDYLIGGWNMGFWPIVGTVISTWCGASIFIGTVSLSFIYGFSAYLRFAFAGLFFTFLLVAVFGKCLRRQKLYTLADLFGQRFGAKVGIIPSILSAFIYAIPTTGMQYIAMNTIWTIVFGLDPTLGFIISTALILGFTILGGLPGTIITDAFQAVLIVLGVSILAGAAMTFAGGFSELIANTPPKYLSIAGPFGIKDVLLFVLSVGPFYLVWQSSWQRIFAAKTENIAFRANALGILVAAVVTLCPVIIGLSARQFMPANTSPDLIFSTVTLQLLPPHIGGFIYCALLAALVTSANSFILQGSSNLTYDLYKRLINPTADNARLMLVSRLTVVFIALGALFVAQNFTGIIAIYQWALRITATTLVIPFLATMFLSRTTRTAVVASMLGGFVATLIHPHLNIGIDQTIFGFIFSFLGIALSFVTKHHPDEVVLAVMYQDLPSAQVEKNTSST